MISVLLDRDEDLAVAAPDEQLRDAARLDLLQLARRVGRARHGLAVHRQDDVAGAQRARRRTVRIDVGDDRAGLARRQPQAARRSAASRSRASGRSAGRPAPRVPAAPACGVRRAAVCSASRSSSSTVTFSVFSCLSRRTFTGTVVPGLVAMTIFTSSSLIGDRPAVELDDHVAGLDAALRRRAARRHLRDDRAGARLEAEVLEVLTRHRGHRHADAAADDLALPQLRQQLADGVDRHREADADVALAAARW